MDDLGAWAILGYGMNFVLLPWVLWSKKEAVSTVAWMMAIVGLPFVGGFAFLLFGQNRLEREKIQLKKSSDASTVSSLSNAEDTEIPFRKDPAELGYAGHVEMAKLAQKAGRFYPTIGNQIEVYWDGEQLYGAMERAITEATSHIEMEYYIIRNDPYGLRFRDLLALKARQGVEVRFLYDAIGSFQLDWHFLQPLRDAGAKEAPFLPLNPLKGRFQINLRNHRKILIVDGYRAFTGGINIGQEFSGLPTRYGRWWDLHLELAGPVVRQIREIFAEDWAFSTGEILRPELLYSHQGLGAEIAQVAAGGPDREIEVLHQIYFSALTSARKNAWLMTPYFVPDQAMVKALESAALQGVDVRLMLPWKSNYRLVDYAGRWFYDDLLRAGVKMYGYSAGMLHAKMMTIDGNWSTVGSANFDIRSFRLNFELNVLIYGESFANRLEKMFLEQQRRNCITIGPKNFGERGTFSRLTEKICRLLSPVL